MSGEVKKNSLPRLDPSVLQQKVYTARLHGQRPPPGLYDYVTIERLEIEYVSVELLRPNTWNPNRMTEREFNLLCLSIEEDGFTQAVLVNKDNKIIDGEHRWRAAVSLGFEEIPVVRIPMGEAQMRISTIRHNIARGSNVGSLEEVIYKELEQLGCLDWARHSLCLEEIDLTSFTPPSLPPTPSVDTSFSGEPAQSDEEEFYEDPDPNALPEFESFMTAQAQYLQQQREERLQRAKTKQERDQIKKEMAIYRLSVAFSESEASIVRAVLSGNAAEKILSLCQEQIGDSNESARGKHGEETGGSETGRR